MTPLRLLGGILASGDILAEGARAAMAAGTVDWMGIIQLAGNHFVTPSLAASLRRRGWFDGLPADVADYLDAIQLLNQDRNATLRRALYDIARELNRLGIEPMLLKGANALLPDDYLGAEDRMIGDLDLWIPESRHPDATAALVGLGYRIAGESWQDMLLIDRQRHHHGIPLLHVSLPVKVELHRRILKESADNDRLFELLETRRVTLTAETVLRTPDTMTRLRHNLVHAQHGDRQARKRQLNFRQLLEFARLAESMGDIDPDALLAGLRPDKHRMFREYWAQAERWLGLAYPAAMGRSPRERRELWFCEQAETSRVWSGVFRLYDRTLRLPRRLWGLGVRAVQSPEYFPRAMESWLSGGRGRSAGFPPDSRHP